MPSVTALGLLGQNGMTTADFTAAQVESMMAMARNYINLRVKNRSRVPMLTGTEGTKTMALTDDQDAAFEPLMTCILRENNKTKLTSSASTSSSTSQSESVGAGPFNYSHSGSQSSAVSAAGAINSPQNTIYREMFELAIQSMLDVDTDYSLGIV